MMKILKKVVCKNALCKHYYSLKEGQHCPAEDECKHYSINLRKTKKKIIKCKDCQYCKRVEEDKRWHWECQADGRQKLLLMVESGRQCDYKV